VRALAAGEDPYLLGPAVQLVPGRAAARQAGQLGDVRFFDPAPAVPAAQVSAAALGAALADLAALIDPVCQAWAGTAAIAAFSRLPSSQPTE
jgi:hypothetical protein